MECLYCYFMIVRRRCVLHPVSRARVVTAAILVQVLKVGKYLVPYEKNRVFCDVFGEIRTESGSHISFTRYSERQVFSSEFRGLGIGWNVTVKNDIDAGANTAFFSLGCKQ